MERYKITESELDQIDSEDENEKLYNLMKLIGRKRGALLRGNIVDYDKFLTFSTKLNLTIMKLLEDKRIKLANPSADIYFSRK